MAAKRNYGEIKSGGLSTSTSSFENGASNNAVNCHWSVTDRIHSALNLGAKCTAQSDHYCDICEKKSIYV